MSMRRTLAGTGGAAVLALLLASGPLVAQAASVTPESTAGNPTCQAVGYDYGFKPGAGLAEDVAGSYDDPHSDASVTWSYLGASKSRISWSANDGSPSVSAVIVKGGDGANVYRYSPAARSDTDLRTPLKKGKEPAVSHVQFCYTFNVSVSKDTSTAFERSYTWGIDKTADRDSLTLAVGQSAPVTYTVEVSRTPEDKNFTVSGTITLENPWPAAASVVSVEDSLPDADVECPAATVPANGSLECAYDVGVGSGAGGTNTATATVDYGSGHRTSSGSADYSFGDPTTITDDCVDVSDSLEGILDTNLCDDGEFEYTRDVGPYSAPGTYPVRNVATYVTHDSGATGNDDHEVEVTVPGAGVGCTLTQGYWKTHSGKGPAPYDDTWKLLADEEDTEFFDSGKSWYEVFWTAPSGGNNFYILAHQYMAAVLNSLNGAATPQEVVETIDEATAMFNAASGTDLDAGDTARAIELAETLADYNEGGTGPGHCSE